MTPSTRVNLYWVGAAFLSLFVGVLAGSNDGFKFYKLLNLIGLSYDFLAVVLLSYVILAKGELQEHIAHHISLAFIAFSTILPIGIQMGSLITSNGFVTDLSMYAFIMISMLPMLYVFSSPVLEPTFNTTFSAKLRIKILGLIFLLIGFAFQIISAVSDTFLLTIGSS